MARWVSRGAGLWPVGEKRPMRFTNFTGPRGVSAVKICRSTSHPVRRSPSSIKVRARSSSGVPDGRGPTSTCLRTSANARSPENSFQISAGPAALGLATGFVGGRVFGGRTAGVAATWVAGSGVGPAAVS